jgi:predicted nucleic acid-binding protein
MNGRYFLDTNIFVYSFDESSPEKKHKALELIAAALRTENGLISWQVTQEFLNVATRKFKTPLKPEDAELYLLKVLGPLCRVFPGLELYQLALDIMLRTGYAFYDCLILAGARSGDCTILYSEDFQHGQLVDGVTIVNPFI